MKQQTLAMTEGFEKFGKKTRRALFLEEMEEVVPWGELCSLVTPYYPAAGNGRHPVGLERMLRIYFLQQWFNLSDPAVEEALYDSPVMRRFAQVDLGCEPVPDETTVCKLCHLLEAHDLGARMLEQVNAHLGERGGSHQRRNHCGCDDHPRAQLDEEPRAEARCRDASDEEGQAVVLRDESARGRGQ
jgi:IS5 family transposase